MKPQKVVKMDLQNGFDVDELFQAHAHIWNQTYNFINSMCLKCAIQLGIPDLLHNHTQPFMALSQLSASLPINPAKADGIGRLMSILTHSGFFHKKIVNEDEPEQEAYALTNAGRLLVKDHPLSMTFSLLLSLDPVQMESWHHLSTWFQNDHPTAYHTAHGMAIWENASRNPKLNHLFNNAMMCDSRLVSGAMLHKFKWVFEGLDSLVDVGGGTGTMAKAIAQSFPSMNCTVLDLPHVVAGLNRSDNLNYIGGDMFETIPNADAVLLKWILHDWGDEECVRILKKCKDAISGNGKMGKKVIIIDMVVDHHDKDHESVETQLFLDMLMMVLAKGGRERKEQEWVKLFCSAGFTNYKIIRVLGLRSVIEIYP
ncbi:trans-resveratrol di-O-methyltransferase-like [Prosopis cineraria]|uniref:trans-resveratrol di-O-methyltransferase-like n=1 Tax=Prosopis cineraria TaxID=364024 RepID=UPI00240F09EE|nr:trans-resveratrol di-O-methyltransferase-like [Prosopis cineraria]